MGKIIGGSVSSVAEALPNGLQQQLSGNVWVDAPRAREIGGQSAPSTLSTQVHDPGSGDVGSPACGEQSFHPSGVGRAHRREHDVRMY
jgi:hypothetical protein